VSIAGKRSRSWGFQLSGSTLALIPGIPTVFYLRRPPLERWSSRATNELGFAGIHRGRRTEIRLYLGRQGKVALPETLLELRQITGAKIVHYTPDAQLVDNKSRHFVAAIPLYDVMFTTKHSRSSYTASLARAYFSGAPKLR